jgi:hypothetical protein
MIKEPFEAAMPAIIVTVFVIISRMLWGKLNKAKDI